jgi:hypothetical protein
MSQNASRVLPFCGRINSSPSALRIHGHISLHLPQLIMGLALLILILKTMAWRTGDEHYNCPARFWAKIFAPVWRLSPAAVDRFHRRQGHRYPTCYPRTLADRLV